MRRKHVWTRDEHEHNAATVAQTDRKRKAYIAPCSLPTPKTHDLEPWQVHTLPTHKELLATRRGDLVRAIKMHGGSAAVAARLGLRCHHGNLRCEVVAGFDKASAGYLAMFEICMMLLAKQRTHT